MKDKFLIPILILLCIIYFLGIYCLDFNINPFKIIYGLKTLVAK